MKRLLTMLLAACLLAGCGQKKTEETENETSVLRDDKTVYHAEITMKDMGVIKLELDAAAAPVTVANFVELAEKGFYDGLTIHRAIDGFMIQGGDPTGTGSGGSGKAIKGEFAVNGIENPISHVKGTISMARRSNDYNSANSQFFIMVADYTGLDGQYAAFGHVTEGQEIADAIARDARPIDGNGSLAPEDQPVIESVKITD